jgi:PEP-CTERM motif
MGGSMLSKFLKTGETRKSKVTLVGVAVAGLVILGTATTAGADPISVAGTLVSNGTRDFTGSGFGVVLPVLTLQNPQGDEMGGVGWNGTSDFYFDTVTGTGTGGVPNGVISEGPPHTQTYTFQQLIDQGIDSTANLGIVFNVNETGANPGTTLLDVRIGVYQVSNGAWLLQSGTCSGTDPNCPGPFPVTSQGQGGDGYLFTLSNVSLATYFANPTAYRIGLWANITGTDDGPEDFYFQRVDACVTNCNPPIPEPGTMALLGTGLVAGARAFARRRRKQQAAI